MQLPSKYAAGEMDFTPPQAIANPDGSVEVWDAESGSYVTHYPQQDKATPDWSHATGGDNDMFDPASMTERPSNPIQTFGDPDADDHDAVRIGRGIDDTPIMDHMVECTRCGTPTAEATCPRCGQHLTHQWEYQQEKRDAAPFNNDVPKDDIHHYDMMVPWASGGGGALSHATGAVNSERTSMDDQTLSALNRIAIGKADVDLNDCPECSQPMVKRAGEGYEFCPSCGHKNRVMDAVMSNQWNAANPEMNAQEAFRGQQGNSGAQNMPMATCPQCHNPAVWMGHDQQGNNSFHCNHCGNRFQDQVGSTTTMASMQKGSPYPKNDDEVDHSAPGHNIPDKVNEIYNAVKREHPDYDKSKAMAIAWSRSGLKHEGGILDQAENFVGDTGQLGKDVYNGDVGNVGGDVLNMGADAGKGLAYGIKDHPLMAAAIAAPFALPFAGAGLAGLGASGLLGEGLGGAALDAGIGMTGESAGLGASDLAAQGLKNYPALGSKLIPQRATNLLKGAVGPGAAFQVGHMTGGGGGSAPMQSPGSGQPGGMYASTQPNGGLALTFEEMNERRAWTEHYDLFSHLAADDDQSSDLSTRNDGLNITDPMTQGSQEETGDSLDELLKSLGDDGSANAGNYTPEQNQAIDAFNKALPVILHFNTVGESGADHPDILKVIQALQQAFGENPLEGGEDHGHEDSGESTVDKSDDSDTTEKKPEKKEKESSVTHIAVNLDLQSLAKYLTEHGYSVEFDQNGELIVHGGAVNGGDVSVRRTDEAAPIKDPGNEYFTKVLAAMPVQTPQQTPGAMQPQQQTSVTPCAICGGPHPTDQHPSAVNPPQQGGQFGMASKVQLLEHISGRKPKMCPYHSELVDFSLTTGDPFQARQAVRPSDYGERGTCGKSGGTFEGGCNFKPAMVTQDFWDQRDQASQERRDQRQLQQEQTQQHEQEQPGETFENAGEQEPVAETGYSPKPGELETAVGVGTMNDPAGDALQMAAKMLRQANIVPQGWKLKMEIVKQGGPEHDHVQPTQHGESQHGTHGLNVEAGKTYLLHSNEYNVPDHVKVQQVKPNSVVVTFQFEGGMESQPKELTVEQLQSEGMKFEPVTFTDKEAEPQVLEQPQAQQPDTAPDINEETDLSASHTGEDHGAEDNDLVDGLSFMDESGEPVDYATYAASRREICPPDMQWLWDDVEKGNRVSRRQQDMQQVIAGRQFSQREQADLINEQGNARNSDKFDLSNTHYDMGDAEVPEDHFMFGV